MDRTSSKRRARGQRDRGEARDAHRRGGQGRPDECNPNRSGGIMTMTLRVPLVPAKSLVIEARGRRVGAR
jgi:hypothetical protein